MEEPYSIRRLAENEVYFRQKNRAIEHGLKNLKVIAHEHNQSHLVTDDDLLLQFYCECSDENCRLRIPLRRSEYDSNHKANDTFIIIPGHEVPSIEQIIKQHEKYLVIRKIINPPDAVVGLNDTPIKNV